LGIGQTIGLGHLGANVGWWLGKNGWYVEKNGKELGGKWVVVGWEWGVCRGEWKGIRRQIVVLECEQVVNRGE